jgi:subtilase family serine protease
MLMTDESLEEGALQGQSFFASTGDNGSFCPEITSTGVPGGLPGTSWPAEGTWTTAVGGTTLLADSDGDVTQEIAWIGGGGGITPFETAGDWTIPANPASQLDQYINQGGRSVPDVSTDADSNVSPVLIYAGGTTPEGIGGTSVSAPTMNGLWARIQAASGDRLGLASVRFYDLYDAVNPGEHISEPLGTVTLPSLPAKPVTGFRDITLGANGLFVATPGYDYTTGIGAPLAAKLVRDFREQAHP